MAGYDPGSHVFLLFQFGHFFFLNSSSVLKFLVLVSILLAGFGAESAQADTFYIRANGSGSGTDWANAAGWNTVNFSRGASGATYYIAGGSYSGRTMSTAESTSKVITIKKATEADHGADQTGWNSLSSSERTGQAEFGGQIQFDSSDWIFDGAVGGGPAGWNSGFGFKVTESGSSSAVIRIGYNRRAHHIEVRHVELAGMSRWGTNGGSQANDGIAVYGSDGVTLSFAWMHGIGRCPFFLPSIKNGVFEYIYVESFYGAGSFYGNPATDPHSEVMSSGGMTSLGNMGNLTFRYNLFAASISTGGLMWDNSSNLSSQMYVYGNVFYRPPGTNWEASNGLIGGWTGGSGEKFQNVWVYNNSFVNVPVKSLGDLPTVFNGNQAKNNLWYSSTAPTFAKFADHSHNHFISSGSNQDGATGTTATALPFDPNFASTLNFTPIISVPAGTPLTSPAGQTFELDGFGRQRTTWGRGAYEFFSGASGDKPSAPAHLRVTSD